MENQYKAQRLALMLAAATTLAACAATPPVKPAPPAAKPMALAICQVGMGPTARYVYCEASACPTPTRKTLVAAMPRPVMAPLASKDVDGRASRHSVDIAFPFNSARMNAADRAMLAASASRYAGGSVEICARSDFKGPVNGQKKVVAARARAMRSIVAQQAHGARISERHEVAGSLPVSDTEQVQQRKGTVHFTPPIDVQLKGSQP